jgi:ATP-dependent DNA ligase
VTIKAKKWKGNDLTGRWQVTLKVDGVRALVKNKRVLSRKNKPLYNLDHLAHTFTDAEVWLGDFKKTISAVRSSVKVVKVRAGHVYSLAPLDKRLHLGWVNDPTAAQISALLSKHKRAGCDGIMMRQGDNWLKVKHVQTLDVKITGVVQGKGKRKGQVGALLTTHGRVGTGFNVEVGKALWRTRDTIIGKTVEVEALEMTERGRFRHARYIRMRPDK